MNLISPVNRDVFNVEDKSHVGHMMSVNQSVLDGTSKWSAKIAITGLLTSPLYHHFRPSLLPIVIPSVFPSSHLYGCSFFLVSLFFSFSPHFGSFAVLNGLLSLPVSPCHCVTCCLVCLAWWRRPRDCEDKVVFRRVLLPLYVPSRWQPSYE